MEPIVNQSGLCTKCEEARFVRDAAKAKAENAEKEKHRLDIDPSRTSEGEKKSR
jgi:hypothetical protein